MVPCIVSYGYMSEKYVYIGFFACGCLEKGEPADHDLQLKKVKIRCVKHKNCSSACCIFDTRKTYL